MFCNSFQGEAGLGEKRTERKTQLSPAVGWGELKPDRAVLNAPRSYPRPTEGWSRGGAGGDELAGVIPLPQEGRATFLMAPLMCSGKKTTKAQKRQVICLFLPGHE